MSFAFHQSYDIPALTHIPSVVLIWAPFCVHLFSLLFQQHNCPSCSPGRIKPGLWLCPLDERPPRQHTGTFIITVSGWSSRVQWSWTRTKLRINASSFVMPAAKHLNSKQLTLSSIVGDVKHCLRDVAWGGKGAAPVLLPQSLPVCSYTLITSYRTLHTSAAARGVWQGSPRGVKVTGHLQTDFK